MISFLHRLILVIRIAFNKRKEPFLKTQYLFRYLVNGYFFPSYKKVNYKPLIKLEISETDKYVNYSGKKIFYPDKFKNSLIKDNFNNLLNEQTANGNNINPHKYLSADEMKQDWVIYDIGAAEGSQSKLWLDSNVKHIVLFEPLPSFFVKLKKTFANEIDQGKVTLINCGISDTYKVIEIEGQPIIFDTLESIIKKNSLPMPNYIKADIEGEELNFLRSSSELLKKSLPQTIQITTYHRPDDYISIPAFFSNFKGQGFFSKGVMFFNRDGMTIGSYSKKLYHPVIRKCLYTYNFTNAEA